MAVYADRVKETTTTTGTGTLTLAGASVGYQTFSTGFTVGDRIRFCVTDGTNWEVSDGVLLTSSTLSRENLIDSSSGTVITFAAGSKDVFAVQSADEIANIGLTVAFRNMMVPQ